MRTIRRIWIAIGMILLILLAYELFSDGAKSLGAYLGTTKLNQTFHFIDQDWAMRFEGYQGKPWVAQYCKDDNASMKPGYQSYYGWREPPFSGVYIHNDAEGHRRTWNEKKPGKKVFRIFFVGGSAAWGMGARDDYTIPSLISKTLSEKTPYSVEVTNFGVRGYESTQELLDLLFELRRGNIPNTVIWLDGYNDATTTFENREPGLPYHEPRRKHEFDVFNRYNMMERSLDHLRQAVEPLAVYRIFNKFKKSSQVSRLTSEERDKLAAETLDVYHSNLELAEKLGKVYGFKNFFYWQPVLYTKKAMSSYEKRWSMRGEVSPEDYAVVLHQLDRSQSFQAMKNFHNLSHLFDNTAEPIFLDDCHLSEQGNAAVAARIVGDWQK